MNLSDKQYGLLFAIRRSIRYHDRRRAFFDRLHRLTGVLTILLAGGVLFELAGTGSTAWWLQIIGVVAAVLASFDMVIGYAAYSVRHSNLRGCFVDLEVKIVAGDCEESTWTKYEQERLKIERDEPPIYRALDLLCHNEQCKAEGSDSQYLADISWFKALTSNFWHYSDINLNDRHKAEPATE